MQRQLTIIIPIITGDNIGRCLETMYKYNDPSLFYVYVIDQTGSRETQEKYEHLTHLWIRPYRNLGFSKACNTGIKLAQTPYIMLLNDDTEFMDSRWWQGILDTFEMDHHIIAASPMSPKEGAWGYGLTQENKDTWQPPQEYYRDPKDPGAVIVKGIEYKEEFTKEDYDFLLNEHPRYRKDTMVDAIAMWGPVFKKSGLEKIGLFDEKFYPAGGEDYDMNARAYSCAWPIPRDECDLEFHYRMVATTKSWIWHHWGKSKDDISGKDPGNKLFESRPRWNANEELWPNGFDVWSHGHKEDGSKYPYKRIPQVHVDDL